jgi:hypothetical protein
MDRKRNPHLGSTRLHLKTQRAQAALMDHRAARAVKERYDKQKFYNKVKGLTHSILLGYLFSCLGVLTILGLGWIVNTTL